jgi:hypothetical protein
VFKRLFWLILGASLGFGFSFWMRKVIKQTVERYAPRRLSSELAGGIRALGQDFSAAIADGREAMSAQEAALRAQLESHDGRSRRRALSGFIERA